MRRILFYPFTPTNPTTKTLVSSLQHYGVDAERVTDYGFDVKATDIGIGWGVCRVSPQPRTFINKPDFTRNAANKIRTFEHCKADGVSTVDWTLNMERAKTWVQDGFTVFERHEIFSQEGEGIRITFPGDSIQYAPLYTKFFKQTMEFRIHAWDGRFLHGSEKVLRSWAKTHR
jgi:hypothetical protein